MPPATIRLDELVAPKRSVVVGGPHRSTTAPAAQ
jgi:hypothetical protein